MIAPYRLAQSAGHLLGWIAVLLPVALYAFERSRAASSRAAAHAWGFGALRPSSRCRFRDRCTSRSERRPSASPMRSPAAARQRSAGSSQPASSEAAWESRSARP